MKRGEIWMVDFGPPTGPEQAGFRPAVIVQDDGLSQVFATVIVVPLTTKMKRPDNSVALCHQLMVRGKARLTQRLGEITPDRLRQIMDGIQTALGL